MVPRDNLGLLFKSAVIVVLALRSDLVVGCGGDGGGGGDGIRGGGCRGTSTPPKALLNPAAFSALISLFKGHADPFPPIGPNLGHCFSGTL